MMMTKEQLLRKSELYKYAQCAVIECSHLTNDSKLDILRELMLQEDLWKAEPVLSIDTEAGDDK